MKFGEIRQKNAVGPPRKSAIHPIPEIWPSLVLLPLIFVLSHRSSFKHSERGPESVATGIGKRIVISRVVVSS